MARRPRQPPASDPGDRVLSNEEIVALYVESARGCLVGTRRREGEPASACTERLFRRALNKAWKSAPKRPAKGAPRRFEVVCLDAEHRPVGEPEARASKSAALVLARESARTVPGGACLVVPVLHRGRARVVAAPPGASPPEAGPPETVPAAEPELPLPMLPAHESAVEPEVEPASAVEPATATTPQASAPPAPKARTPYVFFRFDARDGTFGKGSRDYSSPGTARAAFRAMTGEHEGFIAVGEDGTRIFTVGACVDRARVPAEFHDVMRRASFAWKDATVVGDPAGCAAGEPPAGPVDEDVGPVDEDVVRDATPTEAPGAHEWLVARPGALVQGRAAGRAPLENREDAYETARGHLVSDGVLVVRPAAGAKGEVVVEKGIDFDEAKLSLDAKALLRAWSVDVGSGVVDATLPEASPEASPETPPAASEAAIAVAQALVEAGAAVPRATTADASKVRTPFVAKPGWDALQKAADRLDADQRAIFDWRPEPGKHLRVLAGAGSGKTSTAVAFIARLLHDGVAPEALVATTFTNRAGAELRARLAALVPPELFARLGAVGTFDSLATRTVGRGMRGANHDGKRFSGLRPGALWNAVLGRGWLPRDVQKGMSREDVNAFYARRGIHGTNLHGLEIDFPADAGFNAGTIARGVQVLRARGLAPGGAGYAEALAVLPDEPRFFSRAQNTSYSPRELADLAWRATETAKRQLALYDFIDLEMAWLAARRGPQPPRVVLVDEAQDNSLVQLEIAKALASSGSLIAIGDLRQCLYPWRGAFPAFFRDLDRTLGAQTLEIRSNYRSARTVVAAANAFARGARWNPGADQIPKRALDGRVVVQGFPDGEVAQARWIAEDMQARLARGEPLSYDAGGGRRLPRFAVLFATNAEAAPLQLALFKRKIPAAVVGGKFFDTWQMRLFGAYAMLAGAPDDAPDWTAFAEALKKPKRFLGEAFVRAVRARFRGDLAEAVDAASAAPYTEVRMSRESRESAREFARDIADLRTMPWSQAPARIGEILAPAASEADESDEESAGDDASAVPGLDPALNAIIELAALFPTYALFEDFGRRSEAATVRVDTDDAEPPADRVLLSSAYKAKGLEWPVVYLLATNGKLPWAPRPELVDVDREASLERLFYVGATRAMEELIVCWWQEKTESGRVRGGPSPFIARAGLAP